MPELYDGQDPFVYHQPPPEQVEQLQRVRDQCRTTYHTLLECVPPSAERTLAIRKLEECSMWANKAITFALRTTDN